MYRRICFLAVLVMLCSIASAAPVPVFQSGAFVAPWQASVAAIEFNLGTAPDATPAAVATGSSWRSIVTDSNSIEITGNNFLDFDIYFESPPAGDSIQGIHMQVNGDDGWQYKWEGSSEAAVDGGNFGTIGGGILQDLSQDTWHSIKLRLDTNSGGGTWPADPCAGIIRFQFSADSNSYVKDIVFTNIPTAGAYQLRPADGASDVSVDLTLQWLPGAGAVSHTVYISTDEAAVQNGTATSYTPAAPSQAVSLDLAETYYWKVVENDGSASHSSDVYSFSTAEYLEVDNFDGYIDSATLMAYQTLLARRWSEQGTAYITLDQVYASDGNSMNLYYDTTFTTPGFDYSGGCLTYDVAQNFSRNGAVAISLQVRGRTINPPEHIYVKLEDTTGKKVGKYITDTSYSTTEKFQELNIALAEMVPVEGSATPINFAAIKKVRVGIGRQTPVAGGFGYVNLDSIRLRPQRCVSSLVTGDMNNDCTVDGSDLSRMANHWLYDPCNMPDVYAQAPALPPLAHYSFDLGHGPVCINEVSPGTYDAQMRLITGTSAGLNPLTLNEAFGYTGDPPVPTRYWDRREATFRPAGSMRRRDRNLTTGQPTNPNQCDPANPEFRWDPNGINNTFCLDSGVAAQRVAHAIVPKELFENIDKEISISLWFAGDPCQAPFTNWRKAFEGENAWYEGSPGPSLDQQHISSQVPDPDGRVTWRAGEPGAGTNQTIWQQGVDHPEAWSVYPYNNPDQSKSWNHWVFVKDGHAGLMRIYLNGVAVQTEEGDFQSMDGVTYFTIGSSVDNWVAKAYIGKIDEFKIYNYALSQAEAMYLAGRPGPDTPADRGQSIANIKEDASDIWPGIVNFLDLSALAPNWQKTIVFP